MLRVRKQSFQNCPSIFLLGNWRIFFVGEIVIQADWCTVPLYEWGFQTWSLVVLINVVHFYPSDVRPMMCFPNLTREHV